MLFSQENSRLKDDLWNERHTGRALPGAAGLTTKTGFRAFPELFGCGDPASRGNDLITV